MEKLPILFGDDTRESNSRKGKLHSEKEVDSKRKRLKNKRISRQRAKEQLRKKLNNKIAYGGITKFEAQTRKKILANVEDTAGGKYNKSARFFQAMNEQGSGKPNPDLGKARI